MLAKKMGRKRMLANKYLPVFSWQLHPFNIQQQQFIVDASHRYLMPIVSLLSLFQQTAAAASPSMIAMMFHNSSSSSNMNIFMYSIRDAIRYSRYFLQFL